MTNRRTFDPQEARSTPPVGDRPDRACNGVDADVFFPDHASGYPAAVKICHSCPHEAACLAWALGSRQSFGVLGGKTPDERHALLVGA